MLNDTDRLHDKLGNSFCITHNLKGSSIDSWEKQLKENETYRKQKRSNSVYFTHEILSWHRDDAKHINLEKMEIMAREYIRFRNPRGMYVAVPHFDKEHYHIHFFVSGLQYKSGQSMRMSISKMQEIKKDIQHFQQVKFPELIKSVVQHGRSQKSITGEKEYQLKYRAGRESEKEKIISKINDCYNNATSKANFFSLLNKLGSKTYERAGKITGVTQGKYKFRFKRIGFTESKLEKLNQAQYRKGELSQSRTRDIKRGFRKER